MTITRLSTHCHIWITCEAVLSVAPSTGFRVPWGCRCGYKARRFCRECFLSQSDKGGSKDRRETLSGAGWGRSMFGTPEEADRDAAWQV